MKNLKAIEIEINSECNRKCSYCPNAKQSRIEQGIMSIELFIKILVQLQSINFAGRISFSFYNEPLLARDLDNYASLVKEYLPKTNILLYTNGTLLTQNKIENLIKSGIDYFVVTKHENEENYLFDQVFMNLPETLVKNHIKYQSYQDIHLTNRGGLIPHLDKNFSKSNSPCPIPMHIMTITNKGTIVPCFEDFDQVHAMGNINENTIKEIWNSKKYSIFRKKLLLGLRKDFKVCSGCNRTEVLGVY